MKIPFYLFKTGVVNKKTVTFANVSVGTSKQILSNKVSVPPNGAIIITKIASSQDAIQLDILNNSGSTLGSEWGLPYDLSSFPANLEPVDVDIFVSSKETNEVQFAVQAIGTATTLTALRIEIIVIKNIDEAEGMIDMMEVEG